MSDRRRRLSPDLGGEVGEGGTAGGRDEEDKNIKLRKDGTRSATIWRPAERERRQRSVKSRIVRGRAVSWVSMLDEWGFCHFRRCLDW